MDKHIGTDQWSNLPKDLLSTIARRLATRTDLRHFRAVCNSWRSSTPLPPKLSLKLPFLVSPTINKRYPRYCLAESTIYCIQPRNKIKNTKCWIIKVSENAAETDKMLVDPLSRLLIQKFPKTMLKKFNLLDYKVTEIAKEFSINASFFNYEKFCSLPKVVTSSTTVDGNFMVFVLLYNNELYLWKMGDKMWTCIDDKREIIYDDVVFYKRKFYVVRYDGRVLVIDSSFNVTEIASDVGNEGLTSKRLIVSFGELFLLESCFMLKRELSDNNNQNYWKVHKLNEEKNDWVLVNSLGNRAFFVGFSSSFFVSTRDFPGCKRNSIYFGDNVFIGRKGHVPGYNGGIYDLEDGSVGPLSAFPGYSKIFWPPPTWLKRGTRSS